MTPDPWGAAGSLDQQPSTHTGRLSGAAGQQQVSRASTGTCQMSVCVICFFAAVIIECQSFAEHVACACSSLQALYLACSKDHQQNQGQPGNYLASCNYVMWWPRLQCASWYPSMLLLAALCGDALSLHHVRLLLLFACISFAGQVCLTS